MTFRTSRPVRRMSLLAELSQRLLREADDEEKDTAGDDEDPLGGDGADLGGGTDEDTTDEDEEKKSPADVNPDKDLGDSIDSQVDRLFTDYETQAMKDNEEVGNQSTAESDEEDLNGKEKKLDAENFANSVARLISNYDNLIEFRSTLIKRAESFLRDTYDEDTVDAFLTSMREEHGIDAGVSKQDTISDIVPPPAVGALGTPGGGGGGGGAGGI